jgi:hypothetical protein
MTAKRHVGKAHTAAAARREYKHDDLQRDGGGKGHPPQKPQDEVDRELDKALADSFPSSDPPSISQPGSNEPAGDPKIKP